MEELYKSLLKDGDLFRVVEGMRGDWEKTKRNSAITTKN